MQSQSAACCSAVRLAGDFAGQNYAGGAGGQAAAAWGADTVGTDAAGAASQRHNQGNDTVWAVVMVKWAWAARLVAWFCCSRQDEAKTETQRQYCTSFAAATSGCANLNAASSLR